MAIVINDCPFCGADHIGIDEVCSYEYAIECNECRAIGPICGDIMSAINAWNAANKPKEQVDHAADLPL